MKIELGPAFKDLFATEKKWMTILGLAVSMLIPIVGPMVAIGYLFRRFFRVRNGKPTEDFDFNLFGDYLKGGLWPVLASMVAALIFIPLVIVAMVLMMAGPALAQ